MSSYKSAIRPMSANDPQDSTKYRPQARQLQELFPSWSNDDLLFLLTEVNGDVQLAATKITDGTVEPWGEVSRKKDKKAPAATKAPAAARGDSRGARGGRGGRGGPGRGGAVARGRGGPPRGSANGHATNGSLDSKPVAPEEPHHDPTPAASGWGEEAAPVTPAAPAPAPDANGTAVPAPQVTKPATSKMTWAQIARPHEKPALPPAPAHQPTPPAPQPQLTTSAPAQAPPAPEPEAPEQPQQNGWEEPTTAEAPTWDEPPAKPEPAVIAEPWPPSSAEAEAEPAPVVEETPEVVEEPPVVPEEPKVEPKIAEPAPAPAVAAPVALAAQPAATPSPKLTTRSAAAHRQPRYKIPDQPVTMPISFGTGLEKVGMQFGSLSLSGDGTVVQSEPEAPEPAAAEPESPKAPEPVAAPPPPPATAPAASTSLTSVFQQQQTAPAAQNLAPPPQTHHTIPTSISQPATTSPLQQFAQQQQQQQQPPLTNNNTQSHHQQPPHIQQQQHQQSQHLPQQVQQNHTAHHPYTQHGLPTHIDPAVQQAQPPVQQQSATHSSYFRQADGAASAPYFHTPTPPASQAQDSPYGAFGQLGGQGAHQQASHLGAFGASDYAYTETGGRGFYDQYNQPSAFGARNHDDIKGLPGAQQPAPAALTPSAAQGAQQHASQAAGQPQPAAGQGPQQNYPPPLPYYYTHAYPQNQYYGTPYSSAYAPPFVKYPTMFQPGPPGPGVGGAANPAAGGPKQPAGSVGGVGQPQSNPYSQGLYQQQAYEEYQHHPQHAHQHQHSHSLGLGQQGAGAGAGEYGKQLYGGAQGGMQGFMGLGQSGAGGAGPGAGGASAGPRSATSPEAAYKPYAAKDVAQQGGRGAPVQQGQGAPQGQGQGPAGQGPQGQSFYGNRFGSGVGGASGGVGGGPQQHQQGGPHLGYPQGASEPSFYGYQPRQQQGYWQ